MSGLAELSSGKGRGEENFPVASRLIAPAHRRAVIAFYGVARMADDIADHPTATPEEKLAWLAQIEACLEGRDDGVAAAVQLRRELSVRRLEARHMLDLLKAFRLDVVKTRYADWSELMDYCRYSAAPVGRFVLDVHGEDSSTWPASDALCSALQVINHLQDCAKDFRQLDRVYLPADFLCAAGIGDPPLQSLAQALSAVTGGETLRRAIHALCGRVGDLLDEADPLAGQIRDVRLSLEVGIIQALARSLSRRLARRDPLSQRVHHRRAEFALIALVGAGSTLAARARRSSLAPRGNS
ncbi:MAG: squalene synthase HpnC [Caulobacteraceae bacterium]